jgi:hypothetical protein
MIHNIFSRINGKLFFQLPIDYSILEWTVRIAILYKSFGIPKSIL